MPNGIEGLSDIQEGNKCLLATFTYVLDSLLKDEGGVKTAEMGTEATLKRVDSEWRVRTVELKEHKSL